MRKKPIYFKGRYVPRNGFTQSNYRSRGLVGVYKEKRKHILDYGCKVLHERRLSKNKRGPLDWVDIWEDGYESANSSNPLFKKVIIFMSLKSYRSRVYLLYNQRYKPLGYCSKAQGQFRREVKYKRSLLVSTAATLFNNLKSRNSFFLPRGFKKKPLNWEKILQQSVEIVERKHPYLKKIPLNLAAKGLIPQVYSYIRKNTSKQSETALNVNKYDRGSINYKKLLRLKRLLLLKKGLCFYKEHVEATRILIESRILPGEAEFKWGAALNSARSHVNWEYPFIADIKPFNALSFKKKILSIAN